MIRLYTIGFTGKSAEKFFTLLQTSGVKKIIDTRVSNASQLAGFAKGADLAYFARQIGGMEYEHRLELAPTKELLDGYRNKKVTWAEYEPIYLELLRTRQIEQNIDFAALDGACLLCSEDTPDKCHRRLLAEYLKGFDEDIEIVHLK